MPNEYKWTRLEGLVRDTEDGLKSAVVSLVVGMTAVDESGRSAYMDTMLPLIVDPDNFIPHEELTLEWATAHGDKYAEDNDWKASLDKQLEAAAVRPISRPFSWQTKTEPVPPAE